MAKELDSQGNGFNLLKQLENILEHDTLIDEVGFVHPSQFAVLNDGVDVLPHQLVNGVQSADEILSTDTSEVSYVEYDSSVFWNRDHKLAISMQALLPLYNAAMNKFMFAIRQYKMLIDLPANTDPLNDGTFPNSSFDFLENEVMRHSKALLILNCDFCSPWNSRKLVVLRKQLFSLFVEELQFLALILSYSPKSEHAWNHRRWVIKMISGRRQNLQEIVGNDSELVEKIVEKSKMNYRAWSYRCWLVSYMTREQVLNEFKKSRKWAEFHVADNCCFHYRRRLLLRMLEDNSDDISDLCLIWKEELDWDQLLIKRYSGRESIWVHRRFLSRCWIKHFAANFSHHSENHDNINHDLGVFLDNEFQLFHSCLNILDNNFEDECVQSELAASYILWISKQIPECQQIQIQEKFRELGDLEIILNKVCPEKTLLWEGLMG